LSHRATDIAGAIQLYREVEAIVCITGVILRRSLKISDRIALALS